MKRHAVFHRLAEREFIEAAAYFEQAGPGLGIAFIQEVKRCVAGITEFPESGRILVGSVRRRFVHRYP